MGITCFAFGSHGTITLITRKKCIEDPSVSNEAHWFDFKCTGRNFSQFQCCLLRRSFACCIPPPRSTFSQDLHSWNTRNHRHFFQILLQVAFSPENGDHEVLPAIHLLLPQCAHQTLGVPHQGQSALLGSLARVSHRGLTQR